MEELIELYDIAVEKQNRLIKMMAAINGLDLEDSTSVNSSKGRVPMSSDEAEAWSMNQNKYIHNADDLTGFEYGLGYEVAGT